jgi:hypothetical protein
VKTLVASLHHFYNSENPGLSAYTILTTVKDSENPSCQPTPFLQQLRTVKTLVASLQHSYNSEGKRRTVKDPCRQPTRFLQQRKTLAASLHHSYNSEGSLSPAYTILYGLLPDYIP